MLRLSADLIPALTYASSLIEGYLFWAELPIPHPPHAVDPGRTVDRGLTPSHFSGQKSFSEISLATCIQEPFSLIHVN